LRLSRRVAKELLFVQRIGGWRCLAEYCGRILLTLPEIVRLGNLSPADRGMAGRKRRFKVFGRTLILDGTLFSGAREIYGRKVYFAIPEFSIKPTDTVVDLGASCGVFTVLAAVLASRVVAVEAQSSFLDEIDSNAKANHCSHKISAELALVGSATGIFSDPKQLIGASHFVKPPMSHSMREIIERHRLDTINFLKIDIEGSEFDLLSNDNEWLECVEKIAMEVHADYGDVNGLSALLANKGFRVWLVDNDQHVVRKSKNINGYLFAARNGEWHARHSGKIQ
jgi:FkbM family methyltransferase